jgi:hypothetical protein
MQHAEAEASRPLLNTITTTTTAMKLSNSIITKAVASILMLVLAVTTTQLADREKIIVQLSSDYSCYDYVYDLLLFDDISASP